MEFDCSDCGTTLVADGAKAATTEHALGPYPMVLMTCPHCGAGWAQGADGATIERRPGS